jgi:DNA-binding response OmpR family regulator
VTPNDTLSCSLLKAFSEYRYHAITVRTEGAGVEQALRTLPSVILVDRGQLAFEAFRRHAQLRLIPIVAIQEPSSECAEDQCVMHLERGLDACICKQGYRELVARIRAILRTNERRLAMPGIYRQGTLVMDVGRHEVRITDRMVELTPREFEILKQFLLLPHVVLTRQQILNRVWGDDFALDEHALDVHIHSLRRKIEPDASHPRFIVTVRGVGYKLQAGE